MVLINLSQQVEIINVDLGGTIMEHIFENIMIGCMNFPFFAVLLTVPILAVQMIKYKTLNWVRIILNYAAVLYGLCVFALVFLPIPDVNKAAALSTYDIQIVPFSFVSDIIKESPFVLTDIRTYIPTLFNRAILQVIFNVAMTIPFGMLLRYYFGTSVNKIVCYSFILSLFIETAQLTGMFFMFSGSYRLCDVNDLIANTLGGFLGGKIINACHFLPQISSFDHHSSKAKIVVAR